MKIRAFLLTSSVLGAALAAQPALAQSDPQAVAESVTDSNEIIVTAQRREQSLLQVPLSIQAATGEQLQKSGIKELTALQFTVPGYLPQTNSGFTQIFIRGIGNAIYLGADPSVASFVDDVPRIYGSMSDNLVDVERVEVLKGAQGGLYGRNATGGVVNIITRQPSTEEVKGSFVGGYGEKKTFRAAAFINVPISETVAVSLSGERASHDDYIKNFSTGTAYTAANFPTGSFLGTAQQTADVFNSALAKPKIENQDFWSFRGKLLLKPSDTLKITLAADYYKKDDNSGAGQIQTRPDLTQAALGAYFGLFGINAVIPAGFVKTGDGSKFSTNAGWPITTLVREYGFSGTVVWEAPGFDITSITAHRRQRTGLQSDVNATNVATALLDVNFKKHFTYQEVRAVSTFDGAWSLIAGGSYLENVQEGGQVVSLLTRAFQVGNGFVSDRIKNWSVYAEAGYDFTDQLNLKVSGRYLHEKNKAHFTKPIDSRAAATQKKFIPSATLTYAIEGGSVYARWARGFKTGGINLATAAAYYPRPEDGSLFGPETVDTFEAGYKQSLFDRKVQVTSAIFYNDYKNLQVDARARPAFPQLTTAIVNANSARTWGVEGSVNWRVTDPLTVGVTAGYLNAKYKDFKLIGSIALEDFDLSGQQMPKAPKWQLSFNADFDQPINDDLRLVSSLLVSHTSKVLFQTSAFPGVLPDATGPGYTLVNARIGLKTTDNKYGIALVADNLFNEAYYTFGQAGFTGVSRGWGNPRIIRGEFSIKY